jgi:protein O-GlcNAc transferase
MGIPVVTLAGRTHAGRVGASLLARVGLDALVTSSPDEYVAAAAQLARDVPGLANLRSSLRGRVARSPLGDRQAFARDVEAAFRQMWRLWCARS